MKLVTNKDIIDLKISGKFCYEWVENMISKKKNSDIILPPKISIHPFENSFCNIMPTLYPKEFLGMKVVTRFPDRQPSLDGKILLLDSISGEFLAIMDANWITTMRTGAVAAHSINLFGKSNYSSVGIIGLGNTARATILILSDIVKDRNLKIKLLKYKGQEELFKQRFAHIKNFEFEFVDSYIDVVKDSDIVLSCATYFESDICPDNYFKKGVTVVPVHTRGFSNCDLFFDKVFADDTGHVCHFKYFNSFKQFAEVTNVLNGDVKGRENDYERILIYNIGIALHDIYFASNIYKMLDKTKLMNIDFKEPTEKFYI